MCADASWTHTNAITATNKNRFMRTSAKIVFRLLADHKDRKRAGYRRASGSAASAGRGWRSGSALIAHCEDVVRFVIERDRPGTVHRLQILLNLERCRVLFLNDGQCTVAVCAECFHRRRIEYRAIGAPGERKGGEDLAVVRTEDDHLGFRCRRISRSGTRGEKDTVFRVQGKPVTSADVAKRIVRGRLHCLDIDDRDASLRVLHDDVEHPFAIRYALFRHAAQIDRAEHRAILGVNHSRIFRRMTEHVDSVIEGVEDNAVWSGARSYL